MPDLLTRAAAGAAAGFAATGPMTLVMAGAREALPADEQHSLPPRIVTERAAQQAGVAHKMDEPEKKAATTAAHFGFGAAAGAVYGVVAPGLPFDPVGNGVAFGLGVWASSYVGWLPAAGLHPPAHRESAGRNAMNVAAHVVWGAVLGLLTDQLAGSRAGEDGRQLNRPAPEVMASG
jgi:uncharacterized membrane protein YagU involved in acid resistance